MINLPVIQSLIEKTSAASNAISIDEDSYSVPLDLKSDFGTAWGKPFVVKTDLIKLQTSLEGESRKVISLEDSLLIKCANAVELYGAYAQYMKQAERIKETLSLTKQEWKLLGEGEPLPDNLRKRISGSIDAVGDLSDASKKSLKRFMTADKADRELDLGGFKGLSRQDAFQPVAATAFDLRIDYSGYIDEVIKTLMRSPTLTAELLKLKPIKNRLAEKQPYQSELKNAFITLCRFCKEYESTGGAWMRDDPRCESAREALHEIQVWAQTEFGFYDGICLTVDVSKGAGNFPKVPWVCLLPEGQKATDGVYVSICFGREGNGAVAGFAESVTSRRGLNVFKRSEYKPLTIDVDGASAGTKYNDSFENPKEFNAGNFDEREFRAHIADSLEQCLVFLGLKAKERFGSEHALKFCYSIEDAGFKVVGALPRDFVAALASKPFIILTGNSGTGKTKLAELFAQWLSKKEKDRFALVPVGADWTDNRNVLGFVNHIRSTVPEGESAAVPFYQSTRILDLLLKAEMLKKKPFFLILDEMNLSHVERYFADFLSAMESKEGKLLLHREGRSLPRKPGGPADVPEELALPRNLFVIGTVNVDETTYMFSPKVLDRANVIEFRVATGAPKAFLEAGGKALKDIEPAPEGYAQSFLELSYRARELGGTMPLALTADPANPPPEAKDKLDACRRTITELFELMQERHQEFAFRTMAEILRFLAVDYELTADKSKWDWEAAMDAQILQKILPKLHGARRKIGSLLAALARYCEAGDKTEALKMLATDAAAEAYTAEGDKKFAAPNFKNSHRKLCEMIVTVRRDQFVSFIQ